MSDYSPATAVSAATVAKLRKLDCPTVFNAVHQLTPKDNATGDQWRDANMLDPTYMSKNTLRIACTAYWDILGGAELNYDHNMHNSIAL